MELAILVKNLLVVLLLSMLLSCTNVAASIPFKKDRYYYEEKGEMIWEVKTNQKMLALTFDDGPDQEQTKQILALLNKYDAKSTFFVIGKQVALHPQIVKQMVVEGHEIGNHTYTHAYFKSSTTVDEIRKEIKITEQAIFQATGHHSTLFRPPGGMYNDTIVKVSNQMGLIPVMWSWHQDTRDWSRPGVRKIVNKVLNNARNGDIVLFHDHVRGNTQTIAALELILPELRSRGYRLVTVSELIRTSISKH